MNNYSKDIIESIFGNEETENIKSKIETVLNDKVGVRIAQEGVNVARDVMVVSEAEEEADKADLQGTTDDVGLDPVMDREYFLKSVEIGDVLITLKTIGVGKNKPVSVYIDNIRWEFFAGPLIAEKEVKKFIDSEHYDKWLKSMGKTSNEEESKEEEPKENDDDAKKEEETVDENIINHLRNIKEYEEFTFDNENVSIIIDSEQANAIVAVYETLNKNNKDSFREMLKESRSSFIKILNFSFEQLSITGDSQDESR
jgi:hypothetical protein